MAGSRCISPVPLAAFLSSLAYPRKFHPLLMTLGWMVEAAVGTVTEARRRCSEGRDRWRSGGEREPPQARDGEQPSRGAPCNYNSNHLAHGT